MKLRIDRRQLCLRSGMVAAGLLVVVASGLVPGNRRSASLAALANRRAPAAVVSANDLSTAFRYASQKVIPAVVTVHATVRELQHVSGKTPDGPSLDKRNELLKRFFGDELAQAPDSTPRVPRSEGMGSGVIIDSTGVILTNNHVVKNAEKVTVRLHDGREFEAAQVRSDPKTDIAVIRIEGAGTLPVAALGDSDAMQVGDWVLAVGSPFGLQETVTAGIISAKSRGIGMAEREEYLQTDAAINPGNSGGPLVNLRGEIVGINTAISSHSGGNEGIGFAVPINLAQWVSRQLVDGGTVQRAFLGVGIQPLTAELAKQLHSAAVQGAVVTEVRPNTPAAQGGLSLGDVIVEFDGHAVSTPRELQSVVERAGVGGSHKIVVIRNGNRERLSVNLQPMSKASLAESGDQAPTSAEFSSLGLVVSELTNETRERLGLKDVTGVVVINVAPRSPAETAGIKEGTVITRIGQKNVANVDELRGAVAKASLKDGVLLLVRTVDGSRFIVLKTS